jgi:3-hydroxy-9,10-secoandrosta-1,3,5(10)-triene-9,17-dione monooxygenase
MAERPTNELMEHARRLVPVFRERAALTDSERKVPAESIADLRAAGLLDVLLPRARRIG